MFYDCPSPRRNIARRIYGPPPLGLTASKLALELRIPASRVHEIINEKQGISVDTALRLAKFFETDLNCGSTYKRSMKRIRWMPRSEWIWKGLFLTARCSGRALCCSTSFKKSEGVVGLLSTTLVGIIFERRTCPALLPVAAYAKMCIFCQF